MLSSNRISAPAGRSYESTVSKKQSKLITPRKTVKKNITYGKSSSKKKTTLTQIWDWETIINDEVIKDEKELASLQHVTNHESQEVRNNKRMNDHANSGDYVAVNKRKSLRHNSTDNILLEKNSPFDSEGKVKNIEKTPRKITRDGSCANNAPLKKNVSPMLVIPEVVSESEVVDGQNLPQSKILLSQVSLSSSGITHPLNGDKYQIELCKPVDSLPPARKKRSIGASLSPQTPKRNLALEIPSSQSPATPLSLASRGSVKFGRSMNESSNDPILFNLHKTQSFSPEVMDTFAPHSDFNSTNFDATDFACYNNLNSEIQDTLDPDTYFTLIGVSHSSPTRSSSSSKTVKFVHPSKQEISEQKISRLSANIDRNKEAELNKTSFRFKNEILDSEAESDEEVFSSEESINKNISEKIQGEIKLEKFNLGHQNFLFEQIPEQSEKESYYGGTSDLETQLELEESPVHKSRDYSQKNTPRNLFSKIGDRKNEVLNEETQDMETMRLSTQYLGQMTPRTSESDIFISIDPQRVKEILNRVRDHETRKYKFPPLVNRVWLYERRPICAVKYMAEISSPKFPGEITNENGVGNKEFNSRKVASSWCAYKILQMYELSDPLTLDDLKSKEWLKKAPLPLKWTKIPPAVADELVANIKKPIFEDLKCPIEEVFQSKKTYSPITETPSNNGQSIELRTSNITDFTHPRNDKRSEDNRYSLQKNSEFKKEYPSSQATTVDLSPDNTPRQQPFEIICETPTQFKVLSNSAILPSPQPIELSCDVNQQEQIPFPMASSQLLTESQLLPDSLLNDCTLMPEPILPSSEDYVYN
ncbi:hypothetical protein HI914_07378 [Erysiphe necator]|nr:hypothetical protein HI914_07378 [Erysiphe necator]